ncbi:MAG: DUF4085 family protein [Intestinibacter sp.]|uniref:DUF4085 family protein n=1 Tax=Intestinibacter sp. TaxID=1965304 RepID=UPI002A832AA7|nr:DUF4085 family protein [Intestinibacter sp.]MDY4575242.1 DUF4085 family protein [Intestinibacter sp.]
MKYFTKEWQNNYKDICLELEVSLKAGRFSEKYYQDLYNAKLKEFLEEEKEMSEMEDGENEEDLWNEIHFFDDNGNLVNARDVMTEEEFEKLREEILENERQSMEDYEEEIEPYDEDKLTESFLEMHNREVEELRQKLPAEILDQVADVRVLALGKATRKVKKMIDKYCAEDDRNFEKAFENYSKYWDSISDKIPDNIKENYDFHDCMILKIKNIGDDIVFELDNGGGFTDIKRIIYKKAEMIENNFAKDCYWMYDEIYLADGGFEFHISIDGENGYDYITLKASDVEFE